MFSIFRMMTYFRLNSYIRYKPRSNIIFTLTLTFVGIKDLKKVEPYALISDIFHPMSRLLKLKNTLLHIICHHDNHKLNFQILNKVNLEDPIKFGKNLKSNQASEHTSRRVL